MEYYQGDIIQRKKDNTLWYVSQSERDKKIKVLPLGACAVTRPISDFRMIRHGDGWEREHRV